MLLSSLILAEMTKRVEYEKKVKLISSAIRFGTPVVRATYFTSLNLKFTIKLQRVMSVFCLQECSSEFILSQCRVWNQK